MGPSVVTTARAGAGSTTPILHSTRSSLGETRGLASPLLTSGKMWPLGGLTTRDNNTSRHINREHRDSQPGVNMKITVFREGSVSCARKGNRISTDSLRTGGNRGE